jgi:Kef-type K+ transport system membrane component KefB
MGGASSYLAILAIFGFLFATWSATKISRAAGVSSIVLEITTGVLLGPQILGLISPEYAECSHASHLKCGIPGNFTTLLEKSLLPPGLAAAVGTGKCHADDYHHATDHAVGDGAHTTGHDDTGDDVPHRRLANRQSPRRLAGSQEYHSFEECLSKTCDNEVSYNCGLTPDVFTLIGHAGVAMMIFESGMHFDFEKALIVGPKACVVAVFGTFLPLISGTILAMLYGFPMMPDGLSVGTALAPTSVGIALRLLGEANVLQEDFGQAIITAAFVDDILSLVLFNVLFSLGGDFDVMATVINPIIGIAFMAIAMVAAMKFWPWVICDLILPRVPEGANPKVARGDQVLFFIMMVFLLGYGTITHFLGTHLWGCFIAGMSFACLQPPGHAHHVWVRQTKRMTGWMIRIFFACTVAFSIPVSKLLSLDAFLKGSLMGIGPCILTKVLCAPFMGDAKFVIGWAMVGRAEFAYLIAQMANSGGMIDEEMFSICIWALLYATIFAPFIFRIVLQRYVKKLKEEGRYGDQMSDQDEEAEIEVHSKHVEEDYLKPTVSVSESYTARAHNDDVSPATYGNGDADMKDVVPKPKSGKVTDIVGPGGCCLFFKRFMM